MKAETEEGIEIKVLKNLHDSIIRVIKFNPVLGLVLSNDEKGIIEIWDPDTYDFPSDNKRLAFETMSETDLFELAKNKTCALSTQFSNDGSKFAIYCKDRKIRLFDMKSGKLIKTYIETL